MNDTNSVFPDDAVPAWVRRYTAGAARRHDRFVQLSGNRLPGMRNRHGRRRLAALVVIALDLTFIAAVASFWSIRWASIPLAVGLVVSLTALMMLRVVTGAVGGAPADALDEIQLAQRNAARSVCYTLVMPLMLVVYGVLVGLSLRDSVSSESLIATAWLLIVCVYAISCLPDVLMSWWMADPEPEDDFPSPPGPEARSPEPRSPEARSPEPRSPEPRSPEARSPEARNPELTVPDPEY